MTSNQRLPWRRIPSVKSPAPSETIAAEQPTAWLRSPNWHSPEAVGAKIPLIPSNYELIDT